MAGKFKSGPGVKQGAFGKHKVDPCLLALTEKMKTEATSGTSSQAISASAHGEKGFSGQLSNMLSALLSAESINGSKGLEGFQDYAGSQDGTALMGLRTGDPKVEILDLNISRGEDMPDEVGKAYFSQISERADKALQAIFTQDRGEDSGRLFGRGILDKIVEKTLLYTKNGQDTIKIDLKPEFLGHLQIRVATRNDRVMVRIMTEAPLVREIIEDNLNHLRSALQNQGLRIDELDVFIPSSPETYNEEYEQSSLLNHDDSRHKDANVASQGEEEEDCMPVQMRGTGTNLIDCFV